MTGGVFFDLDGTLIDTAADFVRVLNGMRADRGLEAVAAERLRAVVSDGSSRMVQTAFELEPDAPGFEELRQQLLDRYLAGVAVESRLFPGYEALLTRLERAGIPWGIVTNKPRLYTEALLSALKLDVRLSALVCADDLPRKKPHPDPLFKAAKDASVAAEDSWYVGDHIRDIEAGKAAGMRTVAARYGYLSGPSIDEWKADDCIDDAEGLARLLFPLSND